MRRQSRPARGRRARSAALPARHAPLAPARSAPQVSASPGSMLLPTIRDLDDDANSGDVTSASAACSSNKHPTGEVTMARAGWARGCRRGAPCCLCWCCCCSCSWAKCLAAHREAHGKPRGPAPPLDPDLPPTLEEIQSWGQSFDRLMRSAAGRKVFRDFLRGEYSEENIMFWLACEELKRESDACAVEEKARFIYEDYISILSPKEVSLDSRVREAVNRNMVEPTPHTFDEAQLQIYTLMGRDSYPRFVNSPLYRALARLDPAPAPATPATPAAPIATGASVNS